jgi:hypothetical protein
MGKRPKKGDRVFLEWLDIVADLHSEDAIEPAEAQTCGWIETIGPKYVRIITSRYTDDRKLADRICIPRGCVTKIEVI